MDGALYFGTQQIEGNDIQPIVRRYAVDLPPALLLFALIAAGLIFGTPGVILAAPLTVVAFVLTKSLYVCDRLHAPTTLPGEQ